MNHRDAGPGTPPGVDVRRVRTKICGLTRGADVTAAARLGADALGFVFAASPRRLRPEQARELVAEVPPGVLRVGLFMDQEAAAVEAVLTVVTLDLLQFHGREAAGYCGRFGLPYLKAVSMSHTNPQAVAERYPDAAGLLLDSHAPGGAGGTGRVFDWRRRVATSKPLWLAGGLHPGNVGEAVREFRPYAVDVSSGVESSPGVKDQDLMRRFIQIVQQQSQVESS
jgi:phosphoribosylanthranilate isomerase